MSSPGLEAARYGQLLRRTGTGHRLLVISDQLPAVTAGRRVERGPAPGRYVVRWHVDQTARGFGPLDVRTVGHGHHDDTVRRGEAVEGIERFGDAVEVFENLMAAYHRVAGGRLIAEVPGAHRDPEVVQRLSGFCAEFGGIQTGGVHPFGDDAALKGTVTGTDFQHRTAGRGDHVAGELILPA